MALLEVTDLVKRFRVAGGVIEASTGVSFALERGETLALVGESGCGKSTTGRAILQLPGPDSGSVKLHGTELVGGSSGAARSARRAIQMIFQDARSALNPRRKVRELVGEGLVIAGMPRREIAARVDETLLGVGLDPARVGERRAAELSGGQCQRVAIARAMVVRPAVLVCDEPVASLDVSVQAQVINLLEDMKGAHGLSMLFISHDLSVVHAISDRVAVMYLGRIVEIGDVARIYARPCHPYTRALLDSVPVADPHRPSRGLALEGDLPSPMNPSSGCRFRTRCVLAQPRCAEAVPELREVGDGHRVACHFCDDAGGAA